MPSNTINASKQEPSKPDSIKLAIKSEIKFIMQDAWLKALVIWLPIISTLSLVAIFSAGIATNLSVGIVDNDKTQLSRGLIRYYNASPTLNVIKYYASQNEASEALKQGDVYAISLIPKDLEKNTLKGESPQVSIFYNSQFILIGKLVNSAFIKAHSTYVGSIEALQNLVKTQGEVQRSINQVQPISVQVSPLFNQNTHYGQFLVSAAVPAVWQIFIVATIVLSFSSKHHIFKINQFKKEQNEQQAKDSLIAWLSEFSSKTLMGMLTPYIVIFWLQGMFFLSFFYIILSWPMHGSWLILFVSQFLFVLACACMGGFFYFASLDGARAMSIVAGVTAPAFAFMGVTFPVTDMPLLAQIWRSILPVSHYIELQIGQVNYGSLFISNIANFLCLIGFCVYFFLMLFAIKHQKNKINQNTGTLKDSSTQSKSIVKISENAS
ncbi:MAG: ABC transporter permease [Colwellia sp.]